MKASFIVLPFLFVLIVLGCATVPMTGRQQLTLIPSSELTAMSFNQYQQVISQSKLSDDREKVAMVKRVGENIAQATERYLQEHQYPTQRFEWEFHLIEDDSMVNAWAMPGGKVAVYTGILPIAKDEDGLAVIMGHEIAHVLARHGNERMSQGLLVDLGGAALSVAIEEQPRKTQQLFMTAYGAGAQIGAILPYSRLHESEADRIGLTLMAMAGYNPQAAVPFWKRMNEQAGGGRPPEFLSTHPAPQSRINNLKEHMPEAMEIYRRQ